METAAHKHEFSGRTCNSQTCRFLHTAYNKQWSVRRQLRSLF